MAPTPLLLVRGSVYRIRFASDDPKRDPVITKYCLCLQQGTIVHNRPAFVGVILTTCKHNGKPRDYPWTVYISHVESKTDFGVIAECSQIYTIPKVDVIEYAYSLESETMMKVDQALQFGIGTLIVEDLRRRRQDE